MLGESISEAVRQRTLLTVEQSPCVRIITIDGSEGCAPKDKTVRGELFPLLSTDDMQTFENIAADTKQKFVVVIDPSLVDGDVVNSLSSKPYFVGLALLSHLKPASFNVASKTAIPGFNNDEGRDLLGFYDFPIVALSDEGMTHKCT